MALRIFLLLIPITALARDPVAVRHPEVPAADLRTYAAGEGRETLAESLERTRPDSHRQKKLRELLEKAQQAWLESSLDSARTHFAAIASLALEADWRDSEREAIHYSMLRLAQASEGREAAEWLTRAVLAQPDLEPDTQLFPPPLLARFRQERTRVLARAQEVDLSRLRGRFLLVNGRRVEIAPGRALSLPPGKYRFTLLSDSHDSLTQITTAEKLAQLAAPPLLSGTCVSPTLSGRAGSDLLALYPDGCARELRAGIWRPRELDLRLSSLAPPAPSLVAVARAPASKPLLSQKSWVWIGVATLAASAIYSFESSRTEATAAPPPEKRVRPVSHSGF